MKIAKILWILSVFTLLGAVIFLGCTTGQDLSSSQDTPSLTVQTGEANDAESPIEDDILAETKTPPGPEQITPVPDATQVDTVLILIADRVTSLDPYQMVSIHPDGSVASHLWDTLTVLNEDLEVEPHLAESWRLINNFTWEFKLRQNATFHNGEILDAEAVRFSIERAQTMPNSLETFAEDVNLEQIEILDNYTLRLITHQPVANLPYHLAFLEILPPIYYSETGLDQLAVAPVGSGPYKLGESSEDKISLEAVSEYWKGRPAIPRIIFQTVSSLEERLEASRNGEAALVTDLPPMPLDQWDSQVSRLEAIESTQRMFIGIRVEEGSALADKRVRQALNYGVNVEQLVNEWLDGYGVPYGSWVNSPANSPELAPWSYDPELARNLLSEAGYLEEGITVTLRTPVGVYYQDEAIAETIAQQLADIGVNVNVNKVNNWGVYVQELLVGKTDSLYLLGLNSHGDGLEDAKNLSVNFPFNPTGWQNESFEELLEQAVNTFNENTRNRFLNEAQAIAYEEAPWIWLWRPYDFYGINQGLDWNPRRDGLVYLYKTVSVPSKSGE